MARCRICGSGVAARCEGCVAEMEDRLVCKIELLRHEVNYLRMRCEEEGVAVATPLTAAAIAIAERE